MRLLRLGPVEVGPDPLELATLIATKANVRAEDMSYEGAWRTTHIKKGHQILNLVDATTKVGALLAAFGTPFWPVPEILSHGDNGTFEFIFAKAHSLRIVGLPRGMSSRGVYESFAPEIQERISLVCKTRQCNKRALEQRPHVRRGALRGRRGT